jgi:hypothetical protein
MRIHPLKTLNTSREGLIMLRLSTALLLCGLYCPAVMAQDAVRWLPADSNAILVIDVAAAYKSPIAVQNQWTKKAAESFLAQEILLPPAAKRVTIGAQLDFGDALEPVRENVVLELKPGADLASVVAISGGEIEKVGDKAGLSLDNGRFVIEAAPQLWLMAQPGGRQATSRWVRTGINGDNALAPFLRSATTMVSDEYPIVMALDLMDTVSLSDAKAVLQDLPGTPLKGASLDAAAKVLAGAQGILVKVHLGKTRQAQVRIEFGQSAAPLNSIAMPLVQTVLQQWGASLEDSTAWKAKVDGYALVFDGEVSATGLKRVISVIHPSFIPSEGADPAATQTSATIVASQKYIRSIRQELDGLQATMKRTRDNHALWFERAAKAIDGLPLKNVDPDLQIYGSKVSASLRYQSQSERMGNIRAGTREAQSKANTFYSGFGPYGEFYSNASYGNTPAIRAEENEGSRNVRFTEMKQIEDGMVEIRRKLTNKYNEEF